MTLMGPITKVRHWRLFAGVAVFTALIVNAWRDTSGLVLLILALAAIGLTAVVTLVMLASGASVVHHSRQVEQAIEKVHGPRVITSAQSNKEINQ